MDNWSDSRQDSGAYPDSKAPANEPKAPANDPIGARIPAPFSSDHLSITSAKDLDVDASPVENPRETIAPGKPDIAVANGRKPSRIELEAWAITHARQEAPQ